MDTDGVDAEVLYCEVSAFRYLYLVEERVARAPRAFNDALHDFGSVDPKRLVVSYQIPIHDIDAAVEEVARRRRSAQVAAAPGVPDRARSSRLLTTSATAPLLAVTGDLPICCHIGLNTA